MANVTTPAAGAPLGPYRVRAHNIAADSENKIHDDRVARQYGFAGGLVPGICVFGYLTRPVVAHFGAAWLARGTASARFLQPCYEGEEVTVQALTLPRRPDEPISIELTAERPDASVCARGSAILPVAATTPPDVAGYPTVPLPAERPPASAAALAPGTVLGTIELHLDVEHSAAFADSISDDLPLYRGPEGIAHPALLLGLANHVLVQNVVLGPWIHTASEVTHYSLARYGNTISLRSRVAECFERKGHEFVVLDILVVADGHRPVQRIRHTAIYKPRPQG
jgi:acyl dehydratase